MASFLVKRVASNLLRVRSVASSSRFFSTKGYEFVQHDTKDECILKCDDSLGSSGLPVASVASSSCFFSTKGYEFVQHDTKDECILKCDDSLGSSAARGVINVAFTPDTSPTENLARLLNLSDLRIRYVHGTHVFPRWSVVEDDKALYISRDITAKDIEDVRESVKEFMSGNHEENFSLPVSVSEEEYASGNVKENFKQYDPKRNAFPIIDIMRGDEYAPTGEYYYHVMKDDKEVEQFVESFNGNPQTRNPYGGYAMEIFLDNSLYNIYGTKTDFTGFNRKFFIPKKKVEGTQTIGGNLIFFHEKKFIKPTPWRPT
ncbi:hypothetical protein CTI12_AA550700 [Artemisia annua]|uniref:Uncharacterized protein n=1 Tax=Artemisia annua TaxID=35608 RepID=A0A2U1KYN0_ARTAN|nr:hypothetical protein CTI12_AA550700 [Artemisia annua]